MSCCRNFWDRCFYAERGAPRAEAVVMGSSGHGGPRDQHPPLADRFPQWAGPAGGKSCWKERESRCGGGPTGWLGQL